MNSDTEDLLLDALRNFSRFAFHLLWFSKNSPIDASFQQLRNSVLSLPEAERIKYAKEIEFVRSIPLDRLHDIIFPYPTGTCQADSSKETEAGKRNGLPYVVHKGKELYFPKNFTTKEACDAYHWLIDAEGLTGDGKREKSPHCYQTADFHVESGDVLLDIGCAEALFALDNIDMIKAAYVFECASRWRKPLQATFERYFPKTNIISKFVSDRSTRGTITLHDAMQTRLEGNEHFFVKMDIEGGERDVIRGNADFFRKNKVKLSCCVYHRQDDDVVIDKMLRELGYSTSFSSGFMLTGMNGIHFPYFRHGVIYAKNY